MQYRREGCVWRLFATHSGRREGRHRNGAENLRREVSRGTADRYISDTGSGSPGAQGRWGGPPPPPARGQVGWGCSRAVRADCPAHPLPAPSWQRSPCLPPIPPRPRPPPNSPHLQRRLPLSSRGAPPASAPAAAAVVVCSLQPVTPRGRCLPRPLLPCRSGGGSGGRRSRAKEGGGRGRRWRGGGRGGGWAWPSRGVARRSRRRGLRWPAFGAWGASARRPPLPSLPSPPALPTLSPAAASAVWRPCPYRRYRAAPAVALVPPPPDPPAPPPPRALCGDALC